MPEPTPDTCPVCGEPVKSLPAHIRRHCEPAKRAREQGDTADGAGAGTEAE